MTLLGDINILISNICEIFEGVDLLFKFFYPPLKLKIDYILLFITYLEKYNNLIETQKTISRGCGGLCLL